MCVRLCWVLSVRHLHIAHPPFFLFFWEIVSCHSDTNTRWSISDTLINGTWKLISSTREFPQSDSTHFVFLFCFVFFPPINETRIERVKISSIGKRPFGDYERVAGEMIMEPQSKCSSFGAYKSADTVGAQTSTGIRTGS
jgi:hypothetical protein